MKKLRDKVRKIRSTRWNKLTRGEKMAAVVMSILRIAMIVAVILAIAGVAFAVFMGFVIASCIASALAGGFDYVGRDEHFVRFR